MKLPKTSIIFARNISRRYPSFLIAFAQLFPLLLPEFREKAMGKFGQKQWENSKSGGIYFGQNLLLWPEFSIAFARIFYCFGPNFLLLFPEFPIAFAQISHCFCPNFSFSFCPLPPPASYAYESYRNVLISFSVSISSRDFFFRH